MARKSRYLGYVNAMKKGRAAKPALSIKGKLSQMKEKAKEVNRTLRRCRFLKICTTLF